MGHLGRNGGRPPRVGQSGEITACSTSVANPSSQSTAATSPKNEGAKALIRHRVARILPGREISFLRRSSDSPVRRPPCVGTLGHRHYGSGRVGFDILMLVVAIFVLVIDLQQSREDL